ncbi:hypothetical protein LYNGBM3L_46730 [Moorena producens 3L]|uniref:Uncharacterized protein n=1 Tax=Moorena producens 3L TaxID=489825 RepID=F4XX75_9CYAN|nr:hypothetical protein LYNGBM3L_46730 [Moorena producens 3L]
MEGIQCPVVEALQEQDETENTRYSEARCKEPAGLSQRVHQEHADKYCNRRTECDRVVGSDAY